MRAESPALKVVTPERVAMSLPLAGIGSRALAYSIDLTLLFIVFMAMYFAYTLVGPSVFELLESLSTVLKVTFALLTFVLLWAYWTVSEVVMNGQTVGKRWLKIRVVRADGTPIGFFESAVRNLVRAVDFLPFLYIGGLLVMLFDAKHRRLGDLVAGTVLVREEAVDLSHYALVKSAQGTLDSTAAELITHFLSRFDGLESQARRALGAQLLAQVDPALEAEAQRALLSSDQALKDYLQSRLSGPARG